MELASMNHDFTEIFDPAGKVSLDASFDAVDAETYPLIDSVLKDNKSEPERSEALKLLSACCGYDSLNCASSIIINGDVGYINDVAADTGLSPLHTAAEADSPRCVEMLLKRRTRTAIRSKDERALLPLELSLCNVSLDVTRNPSGDSIGDLIHLLGDKVKLIFEKGIDQLSIDEGWILLTTSLRIVEQYIQAFSNISKEGTTMPLPSSGCDPNFVLQQPSARSVIGCVGVYKNDHVEIIANDQGNRITIGFTNSERLIGEAAQNQVAVNPETTIFAMILAKMKETDEAYIGKKIKVTLDQRSPDVLKYKDCRMLRGIPRNIDKHLCVAMLFQSLKETGGVEVSS